VQTEEGASLTVEFDGCASVDELGNGFQIDGSILFDSGDPDLCVATSSTFGFDLHQEYTNFTLSKQDTSGTILVLSAELSETFTAASLDCVPLAPDPLQYGIRGAGIRTLDGSLRLIQRDVFDGVTQLDVTTAADQFTTQVDLLSDEFDCRVEAVLSGSNEITDAVAGTRFASSFDDLRIVEVPQEDESFLVDLDGGTTTDCVGALNLLTTDPLRLASALACPRGGRLEVTDRASGDKAAVMYDDDGVAFDLGADGTIEDRRANCVKLDLQQCGFEPSQGLCKPCLFDDDCSGDLVCSPCVFCSAAVDSRCGPAGDLVSCGNDVYAPRAPAP
jgi:hypothetical protein